MIFFLQKQLYTTTLMIWRKKMDLWMRKIEFEVGKKCLPWGTEQEENILINFQLLARKFLSFFFPAYLAGQLFSIFGAGSLLGKDQIYETRSRVCWNSLIQNAIPPPSLNLVWRFSSKLERAFSIIKNSVQFWLKLNDAELLTWSADADKITWVVKTEI